MTTTTDSRLALLENWIHSELNWQQANITVASADASFRRYFRIEHNNKTYIAMDAPPNKEDIEPFVDITKRLLKTGIHAPEIIAESASQGFLMLEDLGSTPYQDELTKSPDKLYQDAITALIQLQQADVENLPHYDDARLREEMDLMPEWFLKTHLGIELDDQQVSLIDKCFNDINDAIREQPKGFVHRDYHSRNLMVHSKHNPAVIDYQDAVYGALTYDLVSLLRDCYICWSNSQVEDWALQYRNLAVEAELMHEVDDSTFIRWFDLMGLQRHIKVLGIFCRLNHRDGKTNYMNDLPLTLSYVLEVGKKHPETQKLIELFESFDIAKKIGTVEIPA